MKAFEVLCSKWQKTISDRSLPSLLDDKLSLLLTDPSEKGVSSCFTLLRPFGEEAFSHVLCANGEQLELRSDLGIVHRLLWEKKLLELVCKERSPWYDLYESDAFRSMEFRVCGEIKWGKRSDRLKDSVVNVSLLPDHPLPSLESWMTEVESIRLKYVAL